MNAPVSPAAFRPPSAPVRQAANIDEPVHVQPDPPGLAFAAGTPIETRSGPTPVQDLAPGDRIVTRDGRSVAIRSVGIRALSAGDLHRAGGLAPIRFDPGALPGASDETALVVSPDLLLYPVPDLRVTARAAQMVNGATIRRVIPGDGVTYHRIALDEPATISVAGLLVELSDENVAARSLAPIQIAGPIPDRPVFTPLA